MSFAHYLLQVNLYLIIFYGFYKLLLHKETHFTLNRFYLVAAGVLSSCIPFLQLEWLLKQNATQQVYTSVQWKAVLQQATIVTEDHKSCDFGNLFVYVYFVGLLFFFFRLIFNILLVNKYIKNTKAGTAFSFFTKKIIDTNLPESNVIDSHEEAHIKQWHSLDRLFFELIGIINWFNPIVYLYKKEVKNIHEFLADEQAAKFLGDKAEYAMLILSKSFSISPNALTSNFFNKSIIKKRIYMLHKERSKKTVLIRYVFIIPLLAIFVVFSSATIRKNKKLLAISEQIPLDEPIKLITEQNQLNNTERISANILLHNLPAAEEWKKFHSFLSRTITYPEDAAQHYIQGNILLKFTLKNGKISNLNTSADLGGGCDKEIIRAVLSYKRFKETDNGKYALKVAFRLDGFDDEIQNKNFGDIKGYKELGELNVTGFAAASTHKIYEFTSIEKAPEFPGGTEKFYDYVKKSIRYPVAARTDNVQGKVWLSFIVEKDGKLSNIRVIRGLGSGIDEEAKRILESSPNWNPGIRNGKTVSMKCNININFTIDAKVEKQVPDKEHAELASPHTLKFGDDGGPLIILDGIVLNKDTLKHIKPETIASISVLKDATATAIYGKKGNNGVILITSKLNNNIFTVPELKVIADK